MNHIVTYRKSVVITGGVCNPASSDHTKQYRFVDFDRLKKRNEPVVQFIQFIRNRRQLNKSSILAHRRGAVIQDIVHIERSEESRFLFEVAEFSLETIKKLIAQGYNDAERALTKDR